MLRQPIHGSSRRDLKYSKSRVSVRVKLQPFCSGRFTPIERDCSGYRVCSNGDGFAIRFSPRQSPSLLCLRAEGVGVLEILKFPPSVLFPSGARHIPSRLSTGCHNSGQRSPSRKSRPV